MKLLARLFGARRGAAAVEFAIVAQLLALLFGGLSDIGLVLIKRMRLASTLTAASDFALVNQASVSSSGGGTLAAALGDIIAGTGTGSFADAVVVVNNGPGRQVTGGVASATGGTASDADKCYCPTRSTSVVWGAAMTCGTTCASGLRAGKFVLLTASRAHRPLFSNYGIVHAGTITVTSLVQTE